MDTLLSLKRTGKVLDVGCGNGADSVFLAKQGFDVSALDISQTSVFEVFNRSRAANVSVRTLLEDICKFRTRERFDIVLCIGVIHFLPSSLVNSVLTYLQRITRKGGIHILEVKTSCLTARQLKKVYSGWKILVLKEFAPRKPFESRSFLRFIARKIS